MGQKVWNYLDDNPDCVDLVAMNRLGAVQY